MKALNRAIARTVSQLSRHGAEGCHPPMLMALENHLDALLTMERKQLEQAGISIARVGDKSVVNIAGTGCTGRADGKAVAAHILRELDRMQSRQFSSPLIQDDLFREQARPADDWTPGADDRFITKMPVHEWSQQTVAGFNNLTAEQVMDICQPAPAEQEPPSLPPTEWRVGDTLLCESELIGFTEGNYYRISSITDAAGFVVQDDDGKECSVSGPLAGFFRNCASRQVELPSLPLSQWLAGDKIFFVGRAGRGFTKGKAYEIKHINMMKGFVTIDDDAGNEREFGPGPFLNASFKNYSRRTDEQADVEHHAAKVLGAMAAPAPDVIDMTDPASWQEGDIVLRTGPDWVGFFHGLEYRVAKVIAEKQEIHISRDNGAVWTSYSFDLLRDGKMFTWLRHGDAA